MDWNLITIDAANLDCDRLLSDWRWLVPSELKPFELTLFGDWFFEDARGHVQFLDTVSGTLGEVASSRTAFLAAREDSENRDQWYMAHLAMLCLERGLRPGSGQCLMFKIPPVLSGPLTLDNIEVSGLLLHQSITAQIHRGVKDMPEGTRIDRFTVNGEEP